MGVDDGPRVAESRAGQVGGHRRTWWRRHRRGRAPLPSSFSLPSPCPGQSCPLYFRPLLWPTEMNSPPASISGPRGIQSLGLHSRGPSLTRRASPVAVKQIYPVHRLRKRTRKQERICSAARRCIVNNKAYLWKAMSVKRPDLSMRIANHGEP